VRGLSERYAAAITVIDAANAADPTITRVRGELVPLALAHGRLAAEWIERLDPSHDPLAEPDEALLIAARAHHLRRWEVPRSSYEVGRAGYHRWKRDQRLRHAHDVGVLLDEIGYDREFVARVQSLVRRDNLATDIGSQAVEDAACLVFIETQLADVATVLERATLLEALRKTARKMSERGLAAVAEIPLGPTETALLDEALGA
jgi:hypothetical protein